MDYIDLHCDTLMHLWQAKPGESLYSNSSLCVDIQRLKTGGAIAQFFAIFLPSSEAFKRLGQAEVDDDLYIDSLCSIIYHAAAEHPQEFCLARNAADLKEAKRAGKLAAFLTIEDGRSITSFDKLRAYYEKGIRLVSLTWNHENCLGFPNSKDPELMAKGLKPFGKEIVEEMQRLGMIVDVSHLSDGGFEDLAQIAKKPFIASHSNARALGPHQRNLSDRQLRILADRGGVAGLNFAPAFLGPDLDNRHSCLDLLLAQAEHMRSVGGEELPAIGSDFDGIQGKLDIAGADKMPELFAALQKKGWSSRQIEKFAFGNAMRIIAELL